MRLLSFVCCCALIPTMVRSADAQWATIKGQVVYPADKAIPKRQPLAVDVDKPACLAKGPILDESAIVNPKNRGIKNVVVYLRPEKINVTQFAKEQIHPDDLKRKPAEITITQPCCMFVDRVTIAYVGDTIVVKNPANISHNFFWVSDKNGQHSQNVPAMNSWKIPKPLVAESTPIQYKCTVHPWMSGYVRIFEHPSYAVTDDDGKFEIKNAPVGKFRIVYWHETGVRGGKEGRYGEPIAIAGPTMEMKPVEFEVKP
ncbi:MAG TPA: hypothetical protein VG097_18655 [Gemmata sp.]|nr:hypothetical protein [Gemmata sp.]